MQTSESLWCHVPPESESKERHVAVSTLPILDGYITRACCKVLATKTKPNTPASTVFGMDDMQELIGSFLNTNTLDSFRCV